MSLALLVFALTAVESGGDPDAIGDGGKAVGILQIHEAVIADVNRVYGTKYVWPQDAKDPEKARDICIKYLTHWCKVRFGDNPPTYEQAARIWNGGPSGHRKPATLPYWEKVRKHLMQA